MNIYVGNLSYGIDEDELTKIFEEFGEVESAKIITDKYSGRSKGFAFVEMENAADAQKAIDALDGKELENRNITVNIAREKRENNRRY